MIRPDLQSWRPRLYAHARAGIALAVSLPMTLGLLSLSGCKSGNTAQHLAQSTAPTLEGSMGKCKPGNDASKSLVVEWPMGDRGALESRVKQRLVVVRYSNCEMELITNCSVAGNYDYVSVTPKTENIKITNADELYARIPIGAVKLEGKLERAGELNVDMTLVGRHEAARYRFQRSDLEGRCEGATHVVTGLSVGAFVFYSGSDANIGLRGGAKGTGIEAGGGSSASTEVLNRDGDREACLRAPERATVGQGGELPVGPPERPGPPPGCGALLEVEVVPIDLEQVSYGGSGRSSSVVQLPDTADVAVAGEQLATTTLDKRIKAMTFTALGGYVVAVGGGIMAYVGVIKNKRYDPDASTATSTTVGLAGSPERQDYISGYNASLGLLYGGIGALVLGAGVGLWASLRGKKLRNERSTRLAGFGVVPSPEGVTVGATFEF